MWVLLLLLNDAVIVTAVIANGTRAIALRCFIAAHDIAVNTDEVSINI